jgi:hypothetical protein
MSAASYDAVTGVPLVCRILPGEPRKSNLGAYDPSIKAIDAAFTRQPNDSHGRLHEGDEAVILLDDHRVVSINFATGKAKAEWTPQEGDPAPVSLRATVDQLLLGTPAGVMQWDRKKRTVLANPLGGIAQRPRTLRLLGSSALVATDRGTALLPLTATANDSRGMDTPRGGAATAAAIGSDRTVVVAEPGGWLKVIDWSTALYQRPGAGPSPFVTFDEQGGLLLGDTFDIQGEYGVDRTGVNSGPAQPDMAKHWSTQPSRWDLTSVAIAPGLMAAGGRPREAGRVPAGTPAIYLWYETTGLHGIAPFPDIKGLTTKGLVTKVGIADQGDAIVALHDAGWTAGWSKSTGKNRVNLVHGPGIKAMAVTSSAVFLLQGSGADVRLIRLDAATGRAVESDSAPDAYDLAVSRDGRRLVVLRAGNTVEVRGPELKTVSQTWRLPPHARAGSVAMTASGSKAAFLQGDRALIYSLDDGRTLTPPLAGPEFQTLGQAAWSPDERTLAATVKPPQPGRSSGTVQLWRFDDQDLTNTVCRWTGGGLTTVEWKRFAPGRPYVDLCEGVPQ